MEHRLTLSVNIFLRPSLHDGKGVWRIVQQLDAIATAAASDRSIPQGRIMISSVNSQATHAVTVLTGQKRATIPVEPVAPIKAVKRRTGHTDDVFKASNAIGSMIVIASSIDQSSSAVTAGSADGVDDPGTDTTTENGFAPSNAEPQERGMEAVRRRAAGTGPLAEWAKAYLEARESRTR